MKDPCMKNQGLYNKWLTITGNYSTQLYNFCLEGDCLRKRDSTLEEH